MMKLMSVAALLFAVGCGAAPASTGETDEAFSANGICYEQYQQCSERCGYNNDSCNCVCHNALSNCLTPKGRLYKCPTGLPNTFDRTQPGESTSFAAPQPEVAPAQD